MGLGEDPVPVPPAFCLLEVLDVRFLGGASPGSTDAVGETEAGRLIASFAEVLLSTQLVIKVSTSVSMNVLSVEHAFVEARMVLLFITARKEASSGGT